MVDLSCFFFFVFWFLFTFVLSCGVTIPWSKWQSKTIHLKAKKQKKEIETRVPPTPFKSTPLMTHKPPTRPYLKATTTFQEHQGKDHSSKIWAFDSTQKPKQYFIDYFDKDILDKLKDTHIAYYTLDLQCSPKAQVLKAWSPG